MSHHYSGPDFGFPHGDARLDFTDLYAFPKPGDDSKSILIMNVHPAVGVNPPGPTSAEAFSTEAIYELKIDTKGDIVADIIYGCNSSPPRAGRRPRPFGGLRARRLRGQARTGRSSPRACRSRRSWRHGLQRPAIIASSLAGATSIFF